MNDGYDADDIKTALREQIVAMKECIGSSTCTEADLEDIRALISEMEDLVAVLN